MQGVWWQQLETGTANHSVVVNSPVTPPVVLVLDATTAARSPDDDAAKCTHNDEVIAGQWRRVTHT